MKLYDTISSLPYLRIPRHWLFSGRILTCHAGGPGFDSRPMQEVLNMSFRQVSKPLTRKSVFDCQANRNLWSWSNSQLTLEKYDFAFIYSLDIYSFSGDFGESIADFQCVRWFTLCKALVVKWERVTNLSVTTVLSLAFVTMSWDFPQTPHLLTSIVWLVSGIEQNRLHVRVCESLGFP